MTIPDVHWSCSALLDLLGFSNHLIVGNLDVRTQTGGQAIERLSAFEDAIQLFEKEKNIYPELYPSELYYVRFNDALFIGIDVEFFPPSILTGGYSIDQLKKSQMKKDQASFEGSPAESGSEVAKFLGLVARIHKYINARESEKSFPGCRTVVASGQRKSFKDRKGDPDFFAANLSVSTAYEAERKGSSVGLKGNHLYVEDDVAMAISYCKACYAILGFSKYLQTDSPLIDPYQYQHKQEGTFSFYPGSWTVPEPIILDILRKRFSFRHLNSTVLTNLQLFKDYQELGTKSGKLESEISDSFSSSTPSLAEVNRSSFEFWKQGNREYPILSLKFSLDTDYSNFFEQE